MRHHHHVATVQRLASSGHGGADPVGHRHAWCEHRRLDAANWARGLMGPFTPLLQRCFARAGVSDDYIDEGSLVGPVARISERRRPGSTAARPGS
ncbi:hypothetical protein [Novosphingobium sp. BL-52-GroH]|uniref:hypothetical protein n=1 Tax=Novosphingobium sp. BL-52-GroH TaxID=3349877 RepID=UPI003851131E